MKKMSIKKQESNSISVIEFIKVTDKTIMLLTSIHNAIKRPALINAMKRMILEITLYTLNNAIKRKKKR